VTQEGETTVRIGDEQDDALFARLTRILGELGGQVRHERPRSSGARDIPCWVASLPGARLVVTAERDVGLLVSGPSQVVREVVSRVRAP
jgi:hypothetical protein